MRPIRRVLLIGSGPIVIGQACEFDYSGTQALKALRRNGIRTILLNPNPATIMTDPEVADRTYLEPLTPEALERIIRKERPDAVLPTMGGQTGLNLALEAHRRGILRRHGVRMIGAGAESIRYAEDRMAFRRRMERFGLPVAKGLSASTERQVLAGAERLGYPVLLRTSYTLGGLGSGLLRGERELREAFRAASRLAPRGAVLIEECLEGWYEFELEVMRDRADNCVVVCAIENVDPMGVHTGDSVTVAPAQTLTDREYQRMRQMAFTCIRAVGVDTGGANVQFARHPKTGELLLIEMNPRVSRSSALASKATGVPIAAIAAELALGKTLDQIPNAITGRTTAAFEPSIDYVVVKLPQFQFSKFDEKSPWLGTSMKSIGEAMAIGRTFPEALQKGVRSMEEGLLGLAPKAPARDRAQLLDRVRRANPYRLFHLKQALAAGEPMERLAALSGVHPWFVDQVRRLVDFERSLARSVRLTAEVLARAKALGYGDAQLGALTGRAAAAVARLRRRAGIEPRFLEVDTCAGEFEARTPYFYSSYERGMPRAKSRRGGKRRYVILGSGPNRIGEGLEFDYSCVHVSQAVQEAGHEAVLINSNPETVSTDHDVSTRLYFDPVEAEEVENVLRWERPDGVLLQFGGQQPLNLAKRLADGGWPVLGTPVDSIVRSENRLLFARSLRRLGIPYPVFRQAPTKADVLPAAHEVGFPVLVRPSFVMGGDRIRVFKEAESLKAFLENQPEDCSFLVDGFLSQAIEVDADAVTDGRELEICGILEQIEPAGIHSGDSSMLYPSVSLSRPVLARIEDYIRRIAAAYKIRGLCNLQIAVREGQPYVLELNARASRTVPFLSKATGVPWAKVAARVLIGSRLRDALARYGGRPRRRKAHFAKASAFCFHRFPGPAPALGPEMRSTGESMGIAATPEDALAKARLSAGQERLGRDEPIYCLQDL